MKFVLEGTETERLAFTLLTDEYFDQWVELFKEENVARFLGLSPALSPEELCKLWFKKIYHRYENELGGMNVLVDKKTGQFIGQCGLLVTEVDEQERLEVGYATLPKYWGQGYAAEAAIKCKKLAFERNYANSLISIVHIDNIGSEKVARKNGMSVEKTIDSFKGMPVNIFRINKEE
ncbi:MAG: GNAT family N-acetyltransferase [Bacteroidia bacterium]